MPTAHLVHGFNVSDDGASTLDRIRTFLMERDFTIVEHDSKWKRGLFRDLLSVRFGNSKRAERLAQCLQPDDYVFCHSNGSTVAFMACWLLSQINPENRVRLVLFNPALDADSPVPPAVSNVLCFHTSSDKVVWLSKWLQWHRWGEAGRVGLQGSSKVENVSYESLGLHGMGHSGIFKDYARLSKAVAEFDDWVERLG